MLLFGGLADWGNVFTIILGIASVFTAKVTACMLVKQHKLQQKQYALDQEKLKAQQLEHQPLFQFSRQNGRLAINNKGHAISTTIKSQVYPMITVDTRRYIDDKWHYYVYCYPLSYYYVRRDSGGLNDELVTYISNDINIYQHLEEKRLAIYETLDRRDFLPKDAPVTHVLAVSAIELRQIDYRDIYGHVHTLHYLNNQLISKERYNKLLSISKKEFFPTILSRRQKIEELDIEVIIRQVYATNYEVTEEYEALESI